MAKPISMMEKVIGEFQYLFHVHKHWKQLHLSLIHILENGAAFYLIRASVNLVLAGLLIACLLYTSPEERRESHTFDTWFKILDAIAECD